MHGVIFRVEDADFTVAEARCEPCRASMLKPDKKSSDERRRVSNNGLLFYSSNSGLMQTKH